MTRPKKQKDNQDDDGPTYVDADSQDTISKADFEHLMGHQEVLNRNEKTQEKRDHEDTPLETAGDHHAKADDTVRTEQKIAKVGTQRKRKAVKVVGDGIQDPTEVERATCAAKTDEKKRPPKKKKVKLSFVDETEE